jgi:hypothetical protein
MLEVTRIEKADKPDGDFVEFGPSSEYSLRRLRVPTSFVRLVTFEGERLRMLLRCELVEDRYEATRLEIESFGTYISTRDLTQLGIPSLIRKILESAVPDFALWTALGVSSDPECETLRRDYGFLAQMYWLHNAAHGKPRIEIAETMGISRSTANALLRRIAVSHALPSEKPSKATENPS